MGLSIILFKGIRSIEVWKFLHGCARAAAAGLCITRKFEACLSNSTRRWPSSRMRHYKASKIWDYELGLSFETFIARIERVVVFE